MKKLIQSLLVITAIVSTAISTQAQPKNGTVRLQPNAAIVIDGPLLGGQSKLFAEILAYLHKEKTKHITILLNSEGGTANEVNFIIGAMQVFQRKGGTITTSLPEHGICWSICPLIIAFGDQRIAHEDTSWMFHRVSPDVETIATHSSITIQQVIEKINAFWMKRFSVIDPKLAQRMQDEKWLLDGKDYAFSGREIRRLGDGFVSDWAD
jgi:ATP-dependent protease ClpP protease subunit